MSEVKIILRQIESSDIGALESLASSAFHKITRFPFVCGKSETWYESIRNSNRDAFFAITAAKESGSSYIVGLCGLTEIDWRSRRANLFFVMMDKQKCAATIQNYPTTISGLAKILRYAFKDLGLNKLTTEIVETNKSLVALEDAGFVVEGVSRDAEFLDGQLRQAIILSITSAEYEGRNAGHHN